MNKEYKIYVLGCRGTYPVHGKKFLEFGGSTTSYLIFNGEHAIIVDCGSGLMNAKNIIKDCKKIDVFLTHVHYDHIIGLLGRSVFPLGVDITFYGDFKTWFNKVSLQGTFLTAPFWPVDIDYGNYVQFDNNGLEKHISDDVTVSCMPALHPNGCSTFKFNVAGHIVTFLCDCEDYTDEIVSFVKNSDILFYDSMFDVSDFDKHKGWGHSTWKDACELARKANIKKLYPTHHNFEYDDTKLLDMEKRCKQEFSNSEFSREGLIINL